jgi:putative membrane protein
MKLNRKSFLLYKLFNSSFTGLSVGILFTIYKPLEDPSIYSLGGIVLALSMLLIAVFYEKLLNIKSFYAISILVELVMMISLITFLILDISFVSALIIYCLYQFTFVFGGYLVRAETLVASDKDFLAKIDVLKQIGYLVGLSASYLFYKIMEHYFEIMSGESQIEILHYLLIVLQLFIIVLLLFAFNFSSTNQEPEK